MPARQQVADAETRALELMREALELLDQSGKRRAATRLDHAIAEVLATPTPDE